MTDRMDDEFIATVEAMESLPPDPLESRIADLEREVERLQQLAKAESGIASAHLIRAKAAESQLRALRQGCEGLVEKMKHDFHGRYWMHKIKALLGQEVEG